MDEMKEWLGAAALVISIGVTIYAWMTARSKVNAEHLKAVDGGMKEHDRRIQNLESEIQHMPSKDSQHKLELSIAQMSGEMKTMSANMDSMTRTTRRMEEYLLGPKDK